MRNIFCSFAIAGVTLASSAVNGTEQYNDYYGNDGASAYPSTDNGSAYSSPRPASYYNPSVSGELAVAYTSKYVYHNIVASDSMNEDGVLWVAGHANMPLYTGQQHVDVAYGILSDGELKPHGSLMFDYKVDWEILPNLRAGLGYEFNWRGMRGYLAQERGKAHHGIYHGFAGYLSYDDPGRGYFGDMCVQGGVYGLTGWLVDAQAGKRFSGIFLHNIDLEVSAGIAMSCGFWAGGVDGVDQVNVKAALPIKFNADAQDKGLRLVPFVQTAWAGNTRSRIRTRVHRSVFDTFQFVAGVGVEYKF
jgi:hypothetical protein